MIHIDLRLPTQKGIYNKIAGEENAFCVQFLLLDNRKTLPSVKAIARKLKNRFLGDKDTYIDSVKIDLLYRSPDPCECIPDLHRLLTKVANEVNLAHGGPVRKVLGEHRSIIKGFSTHFEHSEQASIDITVTYKCVGIENLIHKAEPFVFIGQKQ